jgi:hypothetical protein
VHLVMLCAISSASDQLIQLLQNQQNYYPKVENGTFTIYHGFMLGPHEEGRVKALIDVETSWDI